MQKCKNITLSLFFHTVDQRFFTISPVTLQPNETSALVSITVLDDQIVRNDENIFIISASTNRQLGNEDIHITIRENDREY